jgi:hypothetical protein
MKLEHLRELTVVCPVCGKTIDRGEIVAVTNIGYTFRRAHPACARELQRPKHARRTPTRR